jgi:hypothetical protein
MARSRFTRLRPLVVALAALTLTGVIAGVSAVAGSSASSTLNTLVGTGNKVSMRAAGPHTIDMSTTPASSHVGAIGTPQLLPRLGLHATGDLAHNPAAPNLGAHFAAGTAPAGSSATTPSASVSFNGMADSASICPFFGGCQPPDMALAASPNWVLQGVNTSFAVYNTAGAIQAGWPKNAQTFFGVPAPAPTGCDSSHGPFLSDPRAFYDPNAKRFWAASLEVEGAFGVNSSCTFLSRYWIAVSATSNPTGAWHVYAFDMRVGTTNAADFTQFGFDGQAMYFGGNMWNQAGSAYQYDEIFGATKSKMMSGGAVTAFGFTGLKVGSVFVNTVQPVLAESPVDGPRAGLFINSFDINGDPSGHNCFSVACSGLEVWSMANPGTNTTTLAGVTVSSNAYIAPPNATQPGGSVATNNETSLWSQPVYHEGFIDFGLETGINNGTQTVPGILWGQAAPIIDDTPKVTSATMEQQGYYFFSGSSAAFFPALMPDEGGNILMVFEFSSSTVNPEVAYVGRRATGTRGTFHDSGLVLQAGLANTTNSRWGDYEAMSFDGRQTNRIWMAGEYSGSSHDWATRIGRVAYSLTNP